MTPNPANTLALMAIAMAGMTGNSGLVGDRSFSGNCQCRNCRKPTMSSEFCDLRCACAYKAKQREKEAP